MNRPPRLPGAKPRAAANKVVKNLMNLCDFMAKYMKFIFA